jgi:hypothetical protein
MTTSWRRTSVSLAASTMLLLGACATGITGRTQGCAPAQPGSRTIRFDNEGRERVHVYLIGQHREWSLGRVEPGATATLRIPTAALSEPEFLRLAVIVGDRTTLRAARDPRTQLTIAQPALHVLSQRWGFAQGQLTSMGFSGSPGGGSCSAGADGLPRA